MAQSRSARLRVRPAPVNPSESTSPTLQFRILPMSSHSSSQKQVTKRTPKITKRSTTTSPTSIPSSAASSPKTPKQQRRSSPTCSPKRLQAVPVSQYQNYSAKSSYSPQIQTATTTTTSQYMYPPAQPTQYHQQFQTPSYQNTGASNLLYGTTSANPSFAYYPPTTASPYEQR